MALKFAPIAALQRITLVLRTEKDSHTEIVPTSYGELRAVLPRAGRAVGF
jgi:hypothetical protein